MKIVYYSHFGAFSAYLAAALHTGHISQEGVSKAWMKRQYTWILRYRKQLGNLVYMGLDEMYREVYWAGYQRHGEMIRRAQGHLKAAFGLTERVVYVNVGDLEGRMPFFLAHCLFCGFSEDKGYPLFVRWHNKAYPHCTKRVSKVKASLNGGEIP